MINSFPFHFFHGVVNDQPPFLCFNWWASAANVGTFMGVFGLQENVFIEVFDMVFPKGGGQVSKFLKKTNLDSRQNSMKHCKIAVELPGEKHRIFLPEHDVLAGHFFDMVFKVVVPIVEVSHMFQEMSHFPVRELRRDDSMFCEMDEIRTGGIGKKGVSAIVHRIQKIIETIDLRDAGVFHAMPFVIKFWGEDRVVKLLEDFVVDQLTVANGRKVAAVHRAIKHVNRTIHLDARWVQNPAIFKFNGPTREDNALVFNNNFCGDGNLWGCDTPFIVLRDFQGHVNETLPAMPSRSHRSWWCWRRCSEFCNCVWTGWEVDRRELYLQSIEEISLEAERTAFETALGNRGRFFMKSFGK